MASGANATPPERTLIVTSAAPAIVINRTVRWASTTHNHLNCPTTLVPKRQPSTTLHLYGHALGFFPQANISVDLSRLIALRLLTSQRCLNTSTYAPFSGELLTDDALFVEWTPYTLCSSA